jgi:tetratricopeptide (TPR) repeat protein
MVLFYIALPHLNRVGGAGSRDRVSCFFEEVEIPTYGIEGEDPLPRFLHHYPYTRLDSFSDKPERVRYKAIVAENEYLRMTVIPSLGARLYDLYDKVRGRHVFQHVGVIRPANIALRGAWIACGVEFNCLDRGHHTPDNFSPVDWVMKERDDGSVTVYIGNLNLITGVYYAVGLTLRPGKAFLETEVKTFNSRELPTKYYFWTNAAVPVTEGSRVFIPGRHTVDDTFPVTRDGVDVSWYRNCKFPVDAFVIDCEEDFFGYYDYNLRYGVVQHADHYRVPGKKRFTWGTSEDGLFWAPVLSDKGIPYIELQTGKYRTQGIVGSIDPHFYDEWREWWYPIAAIEGISFANKDATVHLKVEPLGDGLFEVFVGVYATASFPESTVIVNLGEETLEEKVDLSPENPYVRTFKSRSSRVRVRVLDKEGKEVVSWDGREYRTKVDATVYHRPREPEARAWERRSAEELFIDGQLEERMGSSLLAELKYEQALKADPGFTRALNSLAALYYRRGLYAKAAELLEKSLERDPECCETRYYLGLCRSKLGDPSGAEYEFWKARSCPRFFTQSSYWIAAVRMRRGDYEGAEEVLREALERNSRDLKCVFLLSALLRRRGRVEGARELAAKASEDFPFYYPLLAELALSDGTWEGFDNRVAAEEQRLLEVAAEYMKVGLYDDAVKVLERGVLQGVHRPLTYYYLGFAHGMLGDTGRMVEYYERGNAEEPDYVFPHRPEEEVILRSVIAATGSPKARYYLGNLLFHLERFDEALEEWRKAEESGWNHPVLYRNLGFAYHRLRRDWEKALEEYEKAIAADPQNYRLYLEYYEVCADANMHGRAVAMLERAARTIRKDRLLAALASAYLHTGKYDEALRLLEENTFSPAEGYYGYWTLYVEASVRKGLERLGEGDIEGAIKAFSKGLEYPRNLGVGAPYQPLRHEAKQRFWIGQCYHLLGESLRAREYWESVLAQKHYSIDEVYYKGLALKALGREEEAVKTFNELLMEAKKEIKNIIELRNEMREEYFYLLNFDKKLAKAYLKERIAQLGLTQSEMDAAEVERLRERYPVNVYVAKVRADCPYYVSIVEEL